MLVPATFLLASFVAQVRDIMFYDFVVSGACRGECCRRSEAGQCI